MSEENKPYLIISKECDEIQINIKRTKPYMELQQENQQLKNDNAVMKAGLIQVSNKQLDLYKEVIEEAREYIESKNNGVCVVNGEEKPAYTFLLDFREAREFVWELLQILDKAKENK